MHDIRGTKPSLTERRRISHNSYSGSFHHQRHSVSMHLSNCRHGFNTLRPGQTGRHFADDVSKCIFLNENVWIPIKMSLKFVPKGPINNNPSLVQIMVWRRPGAKPLFEPMMGSLLTHICVTRPQWVKPQWKPQNACVNWFISGQFRDKRENRLIFTILTCFLSCFTDYEKIMEGNKAIERHVGL